MVQADNLSRQALSNLSNGRSQRSKQPSAAFSRRDESSDDEPTAAQERERFIQLVRSGATAETENDDHKNYMGSTQKRMSKMQTKVPTGMPKCTGGTYEGPVVATHPPAKTGNNCVITNDTHTKATNNGFSRGELGRFFCH
uniref:Uncharacterized protein n=1 Tax=Favella ehrenbergii TaxID=182087 RepID=A0A7S3I311_9SPIT